jgi:hypothetical protein
MLLSSVKSTLFRGAEAFSASRVFASFGFEVELSRGLDAAFRTNGKTLLLISVCEVSPLFVDATPGLSIEGREPLFMGKVMLSTDGTRLLLSTGGVCNARSSDSNSVASEHNEGVGNSRSAVASTDIDVGPFKRRRIDESTQV